MATADLAEDAPIAVAHGKDSHDEPADAEPWGAHRGAHSLYGRKGWETTGAVYERACGRDGPSGAALRCVRHGSA